MNQQCHKDQRSHKTQQAALFTSNSKKSSLPRANGDSLTDEEFGVVIIRRNRNSKSVRLRLDSNATIVITMPPRVALVHATRLIDISRSDIRSWREHYKRLNPSYEHASRIGHAHTLTFEETTGAVPKGKIIGQRIHITYPKSLSTTAPIVQQVAKTYIAKALQKEARSYLPERLKHLALTHGFHYERIRFGTQKGRWGSCSSKGTISLNVALMNQSLEEIDYVLIHELCHTKHMNHSQSFWNLVEQCMPDYKKYRKSLKKAQPTH